jgi:hypothetical protein
MELRPGGSRVIAVEVAGEPDATPVPFCHRLAIVRRISPDVVPGRVQAGDGGADGGDPASADLASDHADGP